MFRDLLARSEHRKGADDEAPSPTSHAGGDDLQLSDTIELALKGAITLREDTLDSAQSDLAHDTERPEAKLSLPYFICSPPWLNGVGMWKVRNRAITRRRIHGTRNLPPGGGYEFVLVPPQVIVNSGAAGQDLSDTTEIATSTSVATALIGVYQIIYGAITLYLARGNQMELYGYASFGLTVVPYILMTIVNLLAQFFTDDYATLYMVRNDVMAVSYTHLTLPTKRIV